MHTAGFFFPSKALRDFYKYIEFTLELLATVKFDYQLILVKSFNEFYELELCDITARPDFVKWKETVFIVSTMQCCLIKSQTFKLIRKLM